MTYTFRKICAVASASILELLRRRDVYVALILALVLLLPVVSVNVFGVKGIVRYVREVTLLLIWIFSLVIITTNAARQIPGEVQRRTILPLLSKPIGRGELLIGKFFGASIAASLALLLFYAGYCLLTLIKSESMGGVVLIEALFLHLLFAFLLTSMTLLGSMLLTPSANVTVCLLLTGGMLLYGNSLSQMATEASAPASWFLKFLHFILPHFEFFDLRLRLVHDWSAVSIWPMLGVTLYTVLYTTAILVAATFIFRTKRW